MPEEPPRFGNENRVLYLSAHPSDLYPFTASLCYYEHRGVRFSHPGVHIHLSPHPLPVQHFVPPIVFLIHSHHAKGAFRSQGLMTTTLFLSTVCSSHGVMFILPKKTKKKNQKTISTKINAVQIYFVILLDLFIALLFHRILCLSAFIFPLFPYSVSMPPPQKKFSHCFFMCDIGIKCLFWLCLSLHARLLCSCGSCMCLCASHCFFLIRSQQSVARWELSLSTYYLLTPSVPSPPHMTYRTYLVQNPSKQT